MGKNTQQNWRYLHDATSVNIVQGHHTISFDDRALELIPLNSPATGTWKLIDWLFVNRKYCFVTHRRKIPKMPRDPKVLDALTSIAMDVQNVEPRHRHGFFNRSNFAKARCCLKLLHSVEKCTCRYLVIACGTHVQRVHVFCRLMKFAYTLMHF